MEKKLFLKIKKLCPSVLIWPVARGSVAEEVSGVDGEEAPSRPSSVWSTASLHSVWSSCTPVSEGDISQIYPLFMTLPPPPSSHFCLFVELLKKYSKYTLWRFGETEKSYGFPLVAQLVKNLSAVQDT